MGGYATLIATTPSNAAPPLTYHGGPVMGVAAGAVTLHSVYWTPNGTSFPSGYATTMDQFFSNVAAGSGKSNNVFSVADQYYQRQGGVVSGIPSTLHATAGVADTSPVPSAGTPCTPDPGLGFTTCVTDAQIKSGLNALLVTKGLSAGLDDQYTVSFPPGVETCFTSTNTAGGGSCSSGTAKAGYCAYHGYTGASPDLVYSVMPYVTYCGGSSSYTGTQAAQSDASVVAHELTESITDPEISAWQDANYNELADECVGEFTNQSFGTGSWDVQYVFSNIAYVANHSNGCQSQLSQTPQFINFTSSAPSTALVGGTYAVSATSSSGLAVSLGVTTPSTCHLLGAVVHFDALGQCSVGASQGGSVTYAVADTQSQAITVTTPAPPPPPPPPPLAAPGYWLVGADGGIFTFGSFQFHGSTGNLVLQRPVVGITATSDRGGYWLVATDGGIFAFGDAGFYGSIPGLGIAPAGSGGRALAAPIVGMVPSSSGGGYFMVAADGGVFAFGDARFAGSCPSIGGCAGAAVAVMPDASGSGYWLVTASGLVYNFGDAPVYGSPDPQTSAVTAAVRTPDGLGYWVLLADGRVYGFGDALPMGWPPAQTSPSNPATTIFATSDGHGYWIGLALGVVAAYGDAVSVGDMSGQHLNAPIIAATGW